MNAGVSLDDQEPDAAESSAWQREVRGKRRAQEAPKGAAKPQAVNQLLNQNQQLLGEVFAAPPRKLLDGVHAAD